MELATEARGGIWGFNRLGAKASGALLPILWRFNLGRLLLSVR